MRCFIGIELPSYIKQNLAHLQKQIGNKYAKIKWVLPKNIHQTLKFLGELDRDEIELVEEALANIKFKRFTMRLDKIGWFPNDDRINVIWIGLKPEKNILNLHGETELKLGSLFKKDDKFSVHLTVGRVKFVKNREKLLSDLKRANVQRDSFLVKDFSLTVSELTRDGPKYKTIRKYDLE